MKRGVERRKFGALVTLLTIAVMGMMAFLPGLVAADPVVGFYHRANPPVWYPMRPASMWFYLFDAEGNCLGTTTLPADTSFVVMHGWWSVLFYGKNPIADDPTLMNPTTRFVLYVDGAQTQAVQKVWVQAVTTERGNAWIVNKWDLTTFRDGFEGTHVFLGEWYYLGALTGQCQVTAAFT